MSAGVARWWWLGAGVTGVVSVLVALRRSGRVDGRALLTLAVFGAGSLGGAALSAALSGSPLPLDPSPLALVVGAVAVAGMWPRGEDAWRFVDAVAPAAFLSLALAQIGCFAHGALVGAPTLGALGLRMPRESATWRLNVAAGFISEHANWSVPVHPLGLYLAALYAAVAGGLLWAARWRAGRPGMRASWGVVAASLGSVAVSLIRDPFSGSPQPFLGETSAAIAAATVLFLLGRRWLAARLR